MPIANTATATATAPQVTAQEVIQRARDLIPYLQEQALRAQQDRKVPEETVRKMQDAGLFRVLQPARWGGYQMDPNVFFEVQMALAEGCMSTAWIYGVIAVHNWQMALFDLRAQEEVWQDDTSVLLSSSYMPVGKVEPVEGGFKFSGRWAFSSGCDHCDWVLLGGVVPQEDKDALMDFRTFLVPRRDYEIVDTWHTFGLQGTGSKDIVIDGCFVPEYRTHRALDDMMRNNPGIDTQTVPLFQIPFGQLFPRAVSTASIGAAQGAINAYKEIVARRVGRNDGAKTVEDPHAQMALAHAQSLVNQLKLKLFANMDQLMADVRAGGSTDINTRIQFRYEAAEVPELCLNEVLELQKMCGGSAIFLNNPIQRFALDILAGRAHVANNLYTFGRNYGGVMLGLDTKDFFL